MSLQNAVKTVFVQLTATLDNLQQQEYVQPSTSLSNNTIGQHVRHIIELFQCLELGYESGIVNYENRKRDITIETDKELAKSILLSLHPELEKENKELVLEANYDDNDTSPLRIATNYYREIAYNLEHTIHHMALIRVGLNELASISLPENFGVASSTVKFRNKCAQ
ncbi:MAG: DinB family protein [Chitinophagaceae bacterium]|nr:DinB family protein [Chitinophagaceae bacterium]